MDEANLSSPPRKTGLSVNAGYTSKEIQQILKLKCVGSVTDAVRPQLRKIIRLFLHNPVKFLQWAMPTLVEVAMEMAMESAVGNSRSPSCEAEMMQREIYLRECMAAGRIDREEIHPGRNSETRKNSETPKRRNSETTDYDGAT